MLIHGEPLSISSASGVPCLAKSFSSTRRTTSPRGLATTITVRNIRLLAAPPGGGSPPPPFFSCPPPLEVDGPEIVRRLHLDVRPVFHVPDTHRRPPRADLSRLLQQSRHRRRARAVLAELPCQHQRQLLWAPARMLATQRQHSLHHLRPRQARARFRPAALLFKTPVPSVPKAPQPLVASRAGDAVLAAQLRDVRAWSAGRFDEPHF